MNRFCKFWSGGVGLMDASTGVMLVFLPELVLRIFKIEGVEAGSLDFLRWIGVFVGSVGLSYGLALKGRTEGEVVWAITSLVRILVALFLAVQIAAGRMPMAWAGVAATDAVVAVVQLIGLRRSWWKEDEG